MRNWRAIIVAVLMPFTAKSVAAQRSATPNRVEQDVSDRVFAAFALLCRFPLRLLYATERTVQVLRRFLATAR